MDFEMSDSDAGHLAQLEARFRAGDEGVLADLFSLYRQRLWRMVDLRLDRRLFGRVDADDILQEAYLDAAQRVQHYFQQDGDMSPFVWVRMIVGQTMVDVHRRHLAAQMRDARLEVSIHGNRELRATSVSLAGHLIGHFTSPSQAAMRLETADQLEKVLEGMDPIDREVLVLRHFEELTNGEVAEVLGLQPKAASIRYIRAIKRLKDVLTRIPGFFDGRTGS
jgi:RNA polymerase sigma-70 factor (ECF subfamily)